MAIINDKLFEYKPNCYIKLNNIESIVFHDALDYVEIGLQSGNTVRCTKKIYYKLKHLFPTINLTEDDIKS